MLNILLILHGSHIFPAGNDSQRSCDVGTERIRYHGPKQVSVLRCKRRTRLEGVKVGL